MRARASATQRSNRPERRDGPIAQSALAREQALERRQHLKDTGESGVVDWGPSRRSECRFEAYWRGMSIGLFAAAEEAWAYLRGLDSVPNGHLRGSPRPGRGPVRRTA
jgi:hypothetical protein